MALSYEAGLERVGRQPGARLRKQQALMFAASAGFHLLILGPMILLAAGDEPRFLVPPELPILNIELDPPRPRMPLPVPDPARQILLEAIPPVFTPPPVERSVPEPIPAEAALSAPRAMTDPRPLTTSLPSVQPMQTETATPETQSLDRPATLAAPTTVTSALPSLAPPRPLSEPQALERPESQSAPSSLNTALPRVQAPTAVTPQADTEAASADQDLPLRRRQELEEAEARAAAAAAALAAGAPGAPSAPMPRIANPVPGTLSAPAGAGSPVPGVSEAWRVAPSSQGSRNARALRSSPLGCVSRERLTQGERDICDERFNADAARGAQNPIRGTGNAARDARFAREGAAAMHNYEATRRPLSGGTGNVTPQDCPGSSLGTGCAGSLLDPSMQMDSSTNIRTNRRDGPRPAGPPLTPGAAGVAGRPGNGTE